MVQRTAFHVPRAEVEPTQVGVAHVRAANVELLDSRNAPKVDTAEVRLRKIYIRLAGNVLVECLEIAQP